MPEYAGHERRSLEASAPASVDEIPGEPEPWKVRAGETHLRFTTADEAFNCAWLHNYMHGHLLLDQPGVEAPRPADRRSPAIASPQPSPEWVDSVLESVWYGQVESAIDSLDLASSIDTARGANYRAASLHALAVKAREVLDA